MEYKGQIWCDRCGKYCGPISDTGVHTCTPNPVIEQLRAELERERMRLAACGTAALGYFNGCADEYRSASLEDVLRLRAEIIEVKHQRDELVTVMRQMEGAVDRYEDNEVREYVKDKCCAARAKVK